MVQTTNETFSVEINTVEYGTYVDDYSESGGTPMYNEKKVWNNKKYKTIIGYEDWEVTLNVLADSATSALIEEFIAGDTVYDIIIGDILGYQVTYSNMVPEDYSYSFKADGVLSMAKLTFKAPGLRTNRVQTVN